MRVLVTGASGLVGSSVASALIGRGDEVVGLARNPEQARSGNAGVSWHQWDAAAERPPQAAFEGVDAVVNLVGEPIEQRWTDAAKERIRASRIPGTRSLVEAIAAAEPRPTALVSGSAVGYYGDKGDAIVDESGAPGSGFDSQVCVDWEAAASEVEAAGVRLVILRTGLILDRRRGLLKQLLPAFKLGLGGPLAGGGQYMPWIHIDDEVGLILWALDNAEVSGVLNATAPNPVTNREFSKALGKALGRPAVIPAPKLAVRLRFGSELSEAAAGGVRAVPRRAQDHGYEFRYPEVDGAFEAALARDG
ncbi:MAG: TIGR01777 family oxidoreductase [Solirubrobacterales bacterium]